jgi:hypothetical protein
VNLLKLHGSINWFRWRPSPPRARYDRWDRWIGAITEEGLRRNWNSEDRPLTLVGRFNKELAYAGAPFTELFAAARMALREISTLVVSGYSFGDKAVNTMITDWIYAGGRGKRRIAVAHEDCASLRAALARCHGEQVGGVVAGRRVDRNTQVPGRPHVAGALRAAPLTNLTCRTPRERFAHDSG